MSKIIMPTNDVIASLRDNADIMYAAKHQIESNIGFQGLYQCDVHRNGVLISGGAPELPNTFTTEGIAYMLNIMFFTGSKAGSLIWYVGLYDLNVTPAVGNTAAAALGAAGTYGGLQATTEMDEATYPSYTTATTALATITNAVAGKAEFTIAATRTIYGAFLTTDSDPTSVAGTLMSAKKFGTARAVVDDDEVSITYTISVTTS